jgi:polyisoprenoid-binding protein YceI
MNRKSLLAAALLATAIGGGAIAQMPTEKPGAADPSRVSGGVYEVDPNHTLVGWRVDHLGYNDYFGLFGDVTGRLAIDPANPAAAKLEVSIPIKPVVASAALGEHLLRPGKDAKAPDFFGPDQQAARFVSTSVAPAADGRSAHIEGNLTLNGVTKPVAIHAEFVGAGNMMGSETVGFHGRAQLRRSDFGISNGIPLVGDEVELDITAAFEKKLAGEPQERPAPGPNACNADKVKPWIGKKATSAVRAQVAKATGAKTIRWVRPDMAVTADYQPDRLGISLSASDVIRSARCG